MIRTKNRNYFWVILISAGIVIYVWQQVESGRLKYSVEVLSREKQEIINTRMHLKIKANYLRSSERLSKVAKEWKFIVPSDKQIKEISYNENN